MRTLTIKDLPRNEAMATSALAATRGGVGESNADIQNTDITTIDAVQWGSGTLHFHGRRIPLVSFTDLSALGY